MHLHLKRGLMNNFVTGLTPFLCKRASASRFDPTLMFMRYYDRGLILSKPVFRNRLVFRCFFPMIFSSPNFIKIFKSPLTGNRSVAIIAVTERLLLFKE